MSANPRTLLIVHIGQHKTGSKALQSFLAHNRARLRRMGVYYPADMAARSASPAYANSQFCFFALLRRHALAITSGRSAAEAYWQQQRPHCRPIISAAEFVAGLQAERRRSPVGGVVVSAEDLFDMQTAHELTYSHALLEAAARHLARLVADADFDLRIVVYLRRQDHLLGAQYAQFIKGVEEHDMDVNAFARAFAPRLYYREVLAIWESAVGRDRIVVRPYERAGLPGGIVPDFFRHGLAMPVPPECVAPSVTTESANVSPDRDTIEFLRILNRRKAAGLPILSRAAVLEAAHACGTAARGAAIGQYLSPPQRRELLTCHAQGNAAVARDFLGRHEPLFAEPPPEDEGWKPYTGLSAEKALAFAMAAHSIARKKGRRWFSIL